MKKTASFLAGFIAVTVFAVNIFAAKPPEKMKPRKVPVGKPEVFEIEPCGIQAGTSQQIKLVGTNLVGLTDLLLSNPALKGELLSEPEATTNIAWVKVTVPAELTRGEYELFVKNTNAQSSKIKLYVDDLPQAFETASGGDKKGKTPLTLPISYWGVLDPPGDVDEISFMAAKGDSLVFDVAARSVGSKANALVTLIDDHGAFLAANSGFDGDDPLLRFQIPATGKYRLRIGETTDAGSKEYFYRVSIGAFPVVVGYFPLGIPANKESDIELIGFNLSASKRMHVKAGAAGEMEVPLDPKIRKRRLSKIVVNSNPEAAEVEPNDTTRDATPVAVGSTIDGRIDPKTRSSPDVDLYGFETRRGQTLVIETDAQRRGSPIDTKIEVLSPDGKPVERLLLQAVRDSHVTFRGIDSVTDDLRVENWQEMELNQFMYLQGEVCKIFRMPQGPDSGFQFYSVAKKRRNYFDTSPVAHAIDEPAYIVEPHAPGSLLVANGLPAFTVYYSNDDDSGRMLGSDSRLLFTAPQDGKYYVRVCDTRGQGGERYCYRLTLREAKPDFKLTVAGADPTINAGAGKDFTVTANRIDGFDDDIRVEITGLPRGFSVLSPLVIQSGHLEAKGTINAALDAIAPSETEAKCKMTATAIINGQTVSKEVGTLGKITLGAKSKLFVALEPYHEQETNFVERAISDKPLEITIAPGQSVPAWLKIKRNGHDDLVTFSVESLPHGVIVDNIGLNGVLIPKGQDSRRIFLTAAKWVPEVDRLCFAKASQAESPTSLPMMLHVRKTAAQLSQSP